MYLIFFKAYKVVRFNGDIIIKGWGKCGLLKAFQKDFQIEAILLNIKFSFYDDGEYVNDNPIEYQELEELFIDDDIVELMAKYILA